MSFSPEKHKLLLKIQNKQTCCKIKRFQLNDKNEIIFGDYTSVRETEPMSERKKKNVRLYHWHTLTTGHAKSNSYNYPYSESFWSAFSHIRTKYGVSLRIQSECGKMRTRITPNTGTFHAD